MKKLLICITATFFIGTASFATTCDIEETNPNTNAPVSMLVTQTQETVRSRSADPVIPPTPQNWTEFDASFNSVYTGVWNEKEGYLLGSLSAQIFCMNIRQIETTHLAYPLPGDDKLKLATRQLILQEQLKYIETFTQLNANNNDFFSGSERIFFSAAYGSVGSSLQYITPFIQFLQKRSVFTEQKSSFWQDWFCCGM